jgi:hypothetical protein
MLIDALLVALSLLGIMVHYFKLFYNQQESCTFWEYLFKHNAKNTVYTLIGTLGTLMPILLKVPQDFSIELVQAAFLAGYGWDSAANKGSPK